MRWTTTKNMNILGMKPSFYWAKQYHQLKQFLNLPDCLPNRTPSASVVFVVPAPAEVLVWSDKRRSVPIGERRCQESEFLPLVSFILFLFLFFNFQFSVNSPEQHRVMRRQTIEDALWVRSIADFTAPVWHLKLKLKYSNS